jgi:hypothetical protein
MVITDTGEEKQKSERCSKEKDPLWVGLFLTDEKWPDKS